MFNINLDEYLGTVKFIQLFDVMLYEEAIKLSVTKESILRELDINPSSFRRCRVEEQNVGKTIVKKLANYFNLKLVDDEYLNKLSKLIKDIYHDTNYKIINRFGFYTKEIDENIKENNIMFPVIKLIKLFLLAFSDKSIDDVINSNNEEFSDLGKYILVFNDDIKVIYDLLELVYCKELTNEMLSKNYTNGICYSILASRQRISKKYIESLYFAQKAKEIFFKENNLKRIIAINLVILNSLALSDNLEEYYSLANEQMLTIKSFDIKGVFEIGAVKHLGNAYLATKKYKDAIDLIEDREEITITELSIYIAAKYFYLGEKFNEWYKKEIVDDESLKEVLFVFNYIVEYLKTSDKKILSKIEGTNLLMAALTHVLKKA